MSATNFRFLTFSLYHIIELEQSFPKMYSLYKAIINRFRDKRQKKRPGRKNFQTDSICYYCCLISENRLGLRKFFTIFLLLMPFRTFWHQFYSSAIIRTLTIGNYCQYVEYRYFSKTGSRIDSKLHLRLQGQCTNHPQKTDCEYLFWFVSNSRFLVYLMLAGGLVVSDFGPVPQLQYR